MSNHRIINFSAGPAALPLPVLEQAQRELVSFLVCAYPDICKWADRCRSHL